MLISEARCHLLLEHGDKIRVESPTHTHCRDKSLLQAHIHTKLTQLKGEHAFINFHFESHVLLQTQTFVTNVPANLVRLSLPAYVFPLRIEDK